MAQLSDDKLFSGTLPGEWRPLLELLAELDRLVETGGDDAPLSAERRRQAATLRLRMLEQAKRLDEGLPASLHDASPTYRRWFSEAVLLWPSFGDSCGKILLDTLKSDRPPDFRIDLEATDLQRDALRRALVRMFGWTAGEMAEIEARLARLTANLQIKKAITRSICRFFETGAGDAETRAIGLMTQLYGPLPWQPGDVDVVITASEVFPCIPYRGTELLSEGYAARPSAERERIAQFLERVHQGEESLKSIRFPAFGLFELDAVAAEFLERLADAVRQEPGMADLSAQAVAATLATMVTILPTSDLNRFLIHDAMGHAWQETLCEFERLFRELPEIGEPLRDWGGAFAVEAGQTVLRPEILTQVVGADLRSRLAVGLNLVISEALADIVEHKFARLGAPLPSSSLLPECPLRIDLTLKDVKRMVRLWSKPYRRLIQHDEERRRLADELREAGFPDAGLLAAITDAAHRIDRDFGMVFEDDMAVRITPDGELRANVLQRVMASMVTFDAAVERFLTLVDGRRQAGSNLPAWRKPAASIDLLVLTLGWFYEQERALNVWHLDELLNAAFAPTLQLLEDALE